LFVDKEPTLTAKHMHIDLGEADSSQWKYFAVQYQRQRQTTQQVLIGNDAEELLCFSINQKSKGHPQQTVNVSPLARSMVDLAFLDLFFWKIFCEPTSFVSTCWQSSDDTDCYRIMYSNI